MKNDTFSLKLMRKNYINYFFLQKRVSSINFPTYGLSRFYGDVINNVLYKTGSFVKNSEEFRDFLLSIRIPEGFSIICLDVQSLFTSIEAESVIECVRSRWNHISNHTSLPLSRFLEGLEWILDNCFFVFDGVTHHQWDLLVSPVLGGLVMEKLEISVLASLDFSPIFTSVTLTTLLSVFLLMR
jgi:hypothetical protein